MYANALSSAEKSKEREKKLCPKYSGIGYAGRWTYELIEVNRDIQIAIAEKRPLKKLKYAVNKNNMLTLRKYGLELIKNGLTTFSELERFV